MLARACRHQFGTLNAAGWRTGWRTGWRAGAWTGGVVACAIALAVVGGCEVKKDGEVGAEGAEAPAAEGPLRVAVTVPPLKGLVGALLPSGGEVVGLMAPGKSEHGYEFSPSDLATLGRSDVVVYVGLGLEPQVHEFVSEHPSARRRVVELGGALGIADESHAHEHHDHAEGEACEHAVDPHVWLDPVLVAKMVPVLTEAVRDAMRARGVLDAAAEAALAERSAALVREVEAVDREYAETLKPLAGAAIVTHHAAFGRLAERYGLKVVEVLRASDTGGEASPARLAEVTKAIREHGVRMIFVEPQFNPATAQRLASAAGVGVGTLDPLGSGDWAGMMRANLKQLAAGLSGGDAGIADTKTGPQ